MLEKILKFLTEMFAGTPGGGTVLLARTVHAPDGKHRVCFFHRKEDGIYGFREELYDNKGVEECWIPMKHGHVEEYPSMDAAIAAAKAEVPWLHGSL
ncbi:MAG: hypothetical protein PHV33_08985 [Elusimicrobiales bacterium]|nr:hypothetical protein [Elusimicrobiales bacterium]